jgi:hypothetical protein
VPGDIPNTILRYFRNIDAQFYFPAPHDQSMLWCCLSTALFIIVPLWHLHRRAGSIVDNR